MFIRVFKAESELEVWMQRGERYELFATYPICHWSGTIGPKLNEGDKQSPEGIYTVSAKQLHLIGRHPRSLNLGFPNALDRQFQRTGSYILIHGGCSSVGCFAMTNPVIEEIFSLSQAALKGGQDAIQVHVFPFRMTEDKMRSYALNEWYDFWRNLKDAYDSFERTKVPPRVSICEGRYWVEDANTAAEVAAQGPLAVCGASRLAGVSQNEVPDSAAGRLQLWSPKFVAHPSTLASSALAPMVQHRRISSLVASPRDNQLLSPLASASLSSRRSSAVISGPNPDAGRMKSPTANQLAPHSGPRNPTTTAGTTHRVPISCNTLLTSCRRFAALQQVKAVRLAEEAARKRARVSQRDASPWAGSSGRS
jgi:hypothetical protein